MPKIFEFLNEYHRTLALNKMIESVSRSLNEDCTVRPRSTGKTKQLKLKSRTKGKTPRDQKRIDFLERSQRRLESNTKLT